MLGRMLHTDSEDKCHFQLAVTFNPTRELYIDVRKTGLASWGLISFVNMFTQGDATFLLNMF